MAKNEIFDTLTEIEQLQKKRKEALCRQDPIAYHNLCNDLGVEPEDQHLYDLGGLEIKTEIQKQEIAREEQRKSPRKREVSTEVYGTFLNDIRGIDITDFSRQVDIKRKILQKYFPYKFDPDGGENLDNMRDAKVGALFNNIVKYAKERVKEQRDKQP